MEKRVLTAGKNYKTALLASKQQKPVTNKHARRNIQAGKMQQRQRMLAGKEKESANENWETLVAAPLYKNLHVEKTAQGTYVVRGDSTRFGEDVILYESYKKSDCDAWVEKETKKSKTAANASRHQRKHSTMSRRHNLAAARKLNACGSFETCEPCESCETCESCEPCVDGLELAGLQDAILNHTGEIQKVCGYLFNMNTPFGEHVLYLAYWDDSYKSIVVTPVDTISNGTVFCTLDEFVNKCWPTTNTEMSNSADTVYALPGPTVVEETDVIPVEVF